MHLPSSRAARHQDVEKSTDIGQLADLGGVEPEPEFLFGGDNQDARHANNPSMKRRRTPRRLTALTSLPAQNKALSTPDLYAPLAFGDGALSANAPVSIVLAEPQDGLVCFVIDSFPRKAPPPTSRFEASERQTDLIFANQIQEALEAHVRLNHVRRSV